MKKRADLQGIRGMAITSVLLYHFYPKVFKNGYVGVDQFFILSGFLMAEILSRDGYLSVSGVFSFYYRRMKRILPLYALFIFSTLLFSFLALPFNTFTYNIPHAIRSLAFISNTKQEDETETYERMLSDAEVLYTHTWSLSCEVQFYAITPFLILMPSFMPKKNLMGIIGVISYVFFTYLWENNSLQQFAFNFMFTRIWQFAIGILCSFCLCENTASADYEPLISENEKCEEYPHNKESCFLSYLSNIICSSLLLVCWFPIEITPHFVRLLVCCLTAALIYTGHEFPNRLLSNRMAVYLGDISYSLYLIHWPVYVYLKQNQMETMLGSSIALVGSICLASLVHEFYEKFYLKLDKKATFGLCAALYLACFVVLAPNLSFEFSNLSDLIDKGGAMRNKSDYYVLPKNLTLEAAMSLNSHLSAIDLGLLTLNECNYTKFRPDEDDRLGWTMCRVNNTEFTGSKRLMFVGNSYAPNIARMFIKLKECQKKAADIYMYTRMTCEVLIVNGKAGCTTDIADRYYEAVKKIKPDILFITDRQIATMEPSNEVIDSIFESEKRYLERIEKEVKSKVYILNALPRPISKPRKYTIVLNDGLKKNGRIDHNLLTQQSANFTLARDRMAKIAKICSKCEIIDLMPSLTKNGMFQMYDEDTNVQYFTNPQHLSNPGLQKVSPVYRQLCKRL